MRPHARDIPATDNARPASSTASKLWSATFVIVVLISFTLFAIGQGLNAGMSVYVERIGGTATFSGVLSIVFSVAAAGTRLALGPVIDARGRMIVATGGAIVLACGTIACGVVVNDAALVVARVAQGIGFAAASTAAATAAADALPPSRMGEGIGYYGLGQAVAMSFGPALALAILGVDPPQLLFFVLTAMTAIVGALAIGCRYERTPEILPADAVYRRRAEAADRARRNAEQETGDSEPRAAAPARPRGPRALFEPRALPGALPLMFMGAAVGFAISFAGLYGERIGVGGAGLFFTLSAVSMIVVRLKSKSFMDTARPIWIYGATIGCGIVAFALLLASPQLHPLFYLAGLFYGVYLGLGVPVNQSVAVKNTPPERWGAGNALVLLMNDLGIGVASLVWGVLNDAVGFAASIGASIGCMVVSYLLARALYPKDV